ncbi:TPA: hypothetical protein ACV439_003377 [Bacillus toyonensis]
MLLSEKEIISKLWDLAVSQWGVSYSANEILDLLFNMFVPAVEEMDTSFLESPESYYVDDMQTDEEHYHAGLFFELTKIIEEALEECTVDEIGQVENKTNKYQVLLDEVTELLTQWKFYLSENQNRFLI